MTPGKGRSHDSHQLRIRYAVEGICLHTATGVAATFSVTGRLSPRDLTWMHTHSHAHSPARHSHTPPQQHRVLAQRWDREGHDCTQVVPHKIPTSLTQLLAPKFFSQ